MYLPAVENGIDAASYWDMTYGEILAAIKGNQSRIKSEFQMQAIIAYRQSDLIATLVGRMFGSKEVVPSLNDAFPGLFPKLEQPRQQPWEITKARIDAYAAERKKRGELNNGNNS